MDTMSPQQGTMGQNRSESVSGDRKNLLENKKKMKTLAHRRQSAPSLVISKALTRSRSTSRESCLTPVSPESCPLVQTFLAECPGRLFLGHAQVQLKTGLQTQERHLFLFSDTLLVAKAKSPTHFKGKAHVRVCEMWMANCLEEVCEGTANPERSFVIGWPTCNCVATFSSEEIKDKWLTLIKSCLAEGKEKDEPKTIPLKIFAKDIGNCAYAKTLAVNNMDTTTDVIRMALLQFGISGCVKDHRLWVSSSKDDLPYPLIGHEFPFSIKMSHIRDGGNSVGGQGGVGGDHSPIDCPEVLLLDQCLPPDTQCQFILKPNKVVPGTAQFIEHGQQKTFKRKRSLINWPFWRGSSTQLDGLPLSPTSLSHTQGQLFGHPLSSICSLEQGLPKPIMDMLVFLYLEGPYTKGVFRRSAGAKACRELRDRLDSGAEDPEISHQSVFIIAAVLKDFMRNIPGNLLCVDMYEQWMEVMEVEEVEERTQGVQRLLNLLPSENLLLLRHIIAILHRIQENAHDNQMNAFNLSVCIAPSMLWAPAPSSPEMEGEGMKTVCELVRFLIENCSSVLGEDVTTLFRNYSQKSCSSDHGSDAASFQMNDSSYDSLENELNDEPESPYQEQLPLRDKDKPDSCSRDSVITLSDCDPDPDQEADMQLPPLARPRRFSPAARHHRARQVNGTSLGSRRLRRSSEPALTLADTTPTPSGPFVVHPSNNCPPLRKASYDAAIDGEREEGEDDVFLEQALNGLQLKEETIDTCEKVGAKVQNGGRRKAKHAPPPPLRLDASCSSLSSPATSPTGSSLSSLDSAFSQYSTDYASNAAILLAEPPPPPLSPPLPGRPHQLPPLDTMGQHPQPFCTVKNNPMPQPNTWTKKGGRQSLKQPERGHVEDSSPTVNGKPISNCNGCSAVVQEAAPATTQSSQKRLSSPPSYQQALLQLQRIRSPFYRGSDKTPTVRELRQLHDHTCPSRPPIPNSSDNAKTPYEVTQRLAGSECVQPPQGVFYGQGATSLVLQRQKSNSLTPAMDGYKVKTLPLPRRASEPAKVQTNPINSSYSSLSLNRSRILKGKTQDGGLRVSDVEPHHQQAHYCLSPTTTRAVQDYFSSQDLKDSDVCLQRSQEVALAIVQGKREWQSKRCSDPRMDDFEKLFFAEESYV